MEEFPKVRRERLLGLWGREQGGHSERLLGKETGLERAQLSLAPSLPPQAIIPEQTRELGPREPQKPVAGDAFDEEFTK